MQLAIGKGGGHKDQVREELLFLNPVGEGSLRRLLRKFHSLGNQDLLEVSPHEVTRPLPIKGLLGLMLLSLPYHGEMLRGPEQGLERVGSLKTLFEGKEWVQRSWREMLGNLREVQGALQP